MPSEHYVAGILNKENNMHLATMGLKRSVYIAASLFVATVVGTVAYAWTPIDNKAEGICAFTQIFDGPGNTSVTVLQNQSMFDSDDVAFIIANNNWSLAKGDVIKDVIKFDAPDYEFWNTPVTLDNALVVFVDTKHFNAFAESYPTTVAVWKGKQKIDELNFEGFYSAYLAFVSCGADKRKLKAEKDSAEAEKKRLENIEKNLPKDPFAKSG